MNASVRTEWENSAAQQETLESWDRKHDVNKLSHIERTLDAGDKLALLTADISLNTMPAQVRLT